MTSSTKYGYCDVIKSMGIVTSGVGRVCIHFDISVKIIIVCDVINKVWYCDVINKVWVLRRHQKSMGIVTSSVGRFRIHGAINVIYCYKDNIQFHHICQLWLIQVGIKKISYPSFTWRGIAFTSPSMYCL